MVLKSSSSSFRRREIGVFTALFAVTFCLFIIGIYTDYRLVEFGPLLKAEEGGLTVAHSKTDSVAHRKLLHLEEDANGKEKRVAEPDRIWSERCSETDVVINQGASKPLPNGIPTYTVEIMNVCASGCNISGIHLSCGWFSSARLVNPRVFKRLRFNDCLVNGGKPLVNGRVLSFEYANTFRYPLTVTSVRC